MNNKKTKQLSLPAATIRDHLLHMLGRPVAGEKAYRNRFCASIGTRDDQDLQVMQKMGLVTCANSGASRLFPKTRWYFATKEGMDLVGCTGVID